MSSFVIAIFIACWPMPEAPGRWGCRSVGGVHGSEAACHRWTVDLARALRGGGAGRQRPDGHRIVKVECLPVVLPAGPAA